MPRAVKKRRVERREPEWGRAFMQRLVRGCVPRILLRVCGTLLVGLGPECPRDLHALELFSGCGAVTNAFCKHGFRAHQRQEAPQEPKQHEPDFPFVIEAHRRGKTA